VAIIFVTCFSALSFANGADIIAEETTALKKSLNAKAGALVSAPVGVFDVEYDDGNIIRLKIKGEADVPTSMRGSKADRFAREKANRDARAAFVKFLGENVIFSESEAEGILLQEKDGSETSESTSASAKIYSSNSAALLKGLIALLDHVEGENDRRTCVVVLGWSRKLVDAANTAKTDMTKNPLKPKEEDVSYTLFPENQNTEKPSGNTETITRIGNVDDF
jgi:hypothetical protein